MFCWKAPICEKHYQRYEKWKPLTGIESNKTGAYGQQPSLEVLKSKNTHQVSLIYESNIFSKISSNFWIKKGLIFFGNIRSKCLSIFLIIKYLALCCRIRRDNTVFCQDFQFALQCSHSKWRAVSKANKCMPWSCPLAILLLSFPLYQNLSGHWDRTSIWAQK